MRRYGVTLSEVLSGRRIDEFICTGHSTEEITAEQERSADFSQLYITLRDNVFSLRYRLITQELMLTNYQAPVQNRLIS